MAKRIKRIVLNSEVPHLWAHQAQDFAANGKRTIEFNGDTIESFGRKVGRLIKRRKKIIGALLLESFPDRSAGWGRTSHRGIIERAVSHLQRFHVATLDDVETNLARYQFRIDEILNGARHGGYYGSNALTSAVELAKEAEHYARLNGKRRKMRVGITAKDRKRAENEIAERAENARKEAEENAKRAKRHEKWALDFLPQYLAGAEIPDSAPHNWSYALSPENRALYDVEANKRRLAENEKRLAEAREALEKWCAGDDVSIPYDYGYRAQTGARMRIVGQTVETTWGANVPLAHVLRALPIVKRIIERGETYQRNGHTIHVGHYTLDSIDVEGTVRVGCHTFFKAEIMRIVGLLEAIPQEESAAAIEAYRAERAAERAQEAERLEAQRQRQAQRLSELRALVESGAQQMEALKATIAGAPDIATMQSALSAARSAMYSIENNARELARYSA